MKIIQAALGRGRISGAAAALGIAALVILVSQAASARAVTPSAALTKTGSASGPRPSIVLVHGAWADSSSWDAVVTRLQRDGYTVYVPPNPLLGLRYDPAFLRDFLNTLSGPRPPPHPPRETARQGPPSPRPHPHGGGPPALIDVPHPRPRPRGHPQGRQAHTRPPAAPPAARRCRRTSRPSAPAPTAPAA